MSTVTGSGESAAGADVSALTRLYRKGPVRRAAALLGPSFVAAVAYIDPGNFATNFGASAGYGYLLVGQVRRRGTTRRPRPDLQPGPRPERHRRGMCQRGVIAGRTGTGPPPPVRLPEQRCGASRWRAERDAPQR